MRRYIDSMRLYDDTHAQGGPPRERNKRKTDTIQSDEFRTSSSAEVAEIGASILTAVEADWCERLRYRTLHRSAKTESVKYIRKQMRTMLSADR